MSVERLSRHDMWTPARMSGPWAVLAAVVALTLGAAAVPAAAQEQTPEELRQQAEQMLGRDLTNQEILDMLRQSGLSPQQIRDRLSARGFDPGAADPWLRVLEGRASQVPEGTSPAPLVSVLAGTDAGRGMGLDTTRIGRVPTDSLRRREPEFGPPVFGRQVFRRATSQFQPVTTGPVPPDYRVGPGDRLVLVLTGAVEQAYQLEVSDEGWIVIPEVGQVYVNGRTVEELREVLFDRLAGSYQSLTGEDPATHFDLSVGRLRTNQVYVIGAVEEPSAYVVSSLATAMTALYRAGGPTRNGSFRRVRVNRGGETVATVDLYDYLVRGDASQDVRLQQGDIVHVPVAETQVRVQGPVTRPAIYELTGDEGLRDLLRFAGGVEPNADLQRVQVRRILPPGERTPGRERAILDVPVGDPGAEGGGLPLRDGDEVQVFAVVEDARNRVTVSGAVWRPGTYGAGEDTRIWDVIQAAGGLLPDAVEARAQIQRLDEETDTRRMIQVSLARNAAGEPAENPRIEGMDQVLIYARRNLREDERVTIGGWVRQPGVYPFARGMTVADLILRAGGVRTGVYTARAEVARPVRSQTRSDTLTRRFEVSLDSTYVFEGRRPAPDELGGEAAGFELRESDAVYVRKAPGYEEPQRVVVTGEVRFPGPYTVRTRQERLTDLVERAGGLTEEAYVEGLQLWRAEEPATDTLAGADSLARRRQARIDSLRRARELLLPGQRDTAGARRGAAGAAALADTAAMEARQDSLLLRMYRLRQEVEELRRERARDRGMVVDDAPLLPVDSAQMVAGRTRVGIDFPRALDRPESPSNLLLQPGDSVHVPRYTPTVDVRGAVGVESKVLWREGAGLGHYISRAGGYLEEADEDRVWIRFANGEVATRGGGFLFFGGGIPDPDPGSTINVPFEPPREQDGGLSTGQFLGILSSIATALIVALSR